MKIAFIIILFYSFTLLAQGLSFDDIPVAETLEQSKSWRVQRSMLLIDDYASRELTSFPTPPKVGSGDFAMTTLARMYKKIDLDQVNLNILDPQAIPWKVGTDFDSVGKICYRQGDYDFVLNYLLKIAYLDFNNQKNLLWPQTREKLYHQLLTQKGKRHYKRFFLGLCGWIKDTENHILMTESARYLTNQLLDHELRLKGEYNIDYDNQENGFDQWMVEHLSEFIKHGFSEFNSKPYQGYALMPIANLYEYAWSPRVKQAAKNVLDYISLKLAIGTNGLRRSVTFRRQDRYLPKTDLAEGDHMMARYAIWVGNYQYLKYRSNAELPYGEISAFMASLETYEVPDPILELFLDKSIPYFQKTHLKHKGIEIFYSSKSFLLSSGGRYKNMFDMGTQQNDVWGIPTTIIPSKGFVDRKDMIRIEGVRKKTKVANLCVAPNFACGFNIVIPNSIPQTCQVHQGRWTFIDLKHCELHLDFYVAIYRESNEKDRKASNFGFLEVREADLNFSDFMNTILHQNDHDYDAKGRQVYRSSGNNLIEFEFESNKKSLYPILRIDSKDTHRETLDWKLLDGEVATSTKEGILFKSPINQKEVYIPFNP